MVSDVNLHPYITGGQGAKRARELEQERERTKNDPKNIAANAAGCGKGGPNATSPCFTCAAVRGKAVQVEHISLTLG